MGWINDLKLRIGAGRTGNSAIAPYATQGPATSLFYPFYTSSAAGSIPNSILANQELGWEKTTQYNVGVDFSLFKNRVSGSVDVYTSNTSDLLMKRSYSILLQVLHTTFANIGETENTGVDITLTTVNITQKDLTWTTTTTCCMAKRTYCNIIQRKTK